MSVFCCFGGGGGRRRNENPGRLRPLPSETNNAQPQRLIRPQNIAIPDALKEDAPGANPPPNPGTIPHGVQHQMNPNSGANPAYRSPRTHNPPNQPRRETTHDHPQDDSMDEAAVALFNGHGVPPEGQGPPSIRHELAADVPANSRQRQSRFASSEPNLGQQSEPGDRHHPEAWLDDAEENVVVQNSGKSQWFGFMRRSSGLPDLGAQQSFLSPDDAQALKEFCRVHKVPKDMRQICKVLPSASSQLGKMSQDIEGLESGLRHKDDNITALQKTIQEGGEDLRGLQGKITQIERQKVKELRKKDETIQQKDQTIVKNLKDYNIGRTELINNHRAALAAEKSKREEESGRLTTQIWTMGNTHAKALEEKETKHNEQMKSLETALESTLLEERTQHAERTKAMEEKHALELQQERTQHQATLKKAEKKIESLRVYLSRSTGADSYRPMPDDSFQGSFQQLAQRITNLVALVSRPDPSRLSRDVDPTSFLARDAARGSNRGWPQFVRSICWAVLVRGFFSGPKGLGAFGGPGTYGHALANHLTDLLRVSQDESGTGVLSGRKPVAASDVSRAEATRAELFDAFIAGLRRHINDNNYVHAIRANVQAVADELFASLQRVSAMSLAPSARNDLADIAESTAVLALEMGSQRAQWMLETCHHGENVIAGERFQDADSTWDSGSITVEFMTLPCLTRVGDGRKDTSARIVVKGEFVAKRIDRIV
ncbi:hypothetical protein B0T10DRAFT_607736 [Thelonectria olida]|uniref:Uncharacterized protein n=1 Tax=Thelonectria olida TaxID=1576542 RepID=A0A9P8W118_9HYPO|nr:hypothetical protein B0T10DRAFT_607736 [Thelonectria olida]